MIIHLCDVIEEVNSLSIFMPTLQFLQPTEDQKIIMQSFRNKMETLYREIETLEPSRGRSLALTKLEEASMWVNKAITKND